MFGYDYQVILISLTFFFTISLIFSHLLIYTTGVTSKFQKLLLIMLATLFGVVVSSAYPERINMIAAREEYLKEQVSVLLKVKESNVEETTLKKPMYDFTFKVEKNLVGIVYDFEDEEIIAIVSNDKYLYEKNEEIIE